MLMQQQQQPLPPATNSYILKKPEKKEYGWLEHDLMTYINDLKCEHFIEDTNSHFSLMKITNFDIIHHQCRDDSLQYSKRYYETIFNSDFKGYKDRICNQAMSSVIHFESDLLKSHIRSDIKKDLISNGIFIRKGRKKRLTDDCKSLKH